MDAHHPRYTGQFYTSYKFFGPFRGSTSTSFFFVSGASSKQQRAFVFLPNNLGNWEEAAEVTTLDQYIFHQVRGVKIWKPDLQDRATLICQKLTAQAVNPETDPKMLAKSNIGSHWFTKWASKMKNTQRWNRKAGKKEVVKTFFGFGGKSPVYTGESGMENFRGYLPSSLRKLQETHLQHEQYKTLGWNLA